MLARDAPVWFFDLDNTLHDASRSSFRMLDGAMSDYIARELQVPLAQADALRSHYWHRYGATLLGLERHHGVRAAHFLADTHHLPGLEAELFAHAHDRAALRRLRGRKFILTNAPADYARRVLTHLGMAHGFEAVISIEGMRTFGQLRPKPDARMLRIVLARLKLVPSRCVLIEDTLAHQKAAKRIGMTAVWMQHYIGTNSHGPEVGARTARRPHYVRATMKALHRLQRLYV